MSVKLDNLKDWYPVSGSIVLEATDDLVRRVRVYLNCLEPTPFFVVQTVPDENGLPVKAPARFLATMPAGLETLEFYAAGDIEIAPDDADRCVYYQCTEHDQMWFDGDGESFTSIHERAPRNEALEWVQYQAELNQKRMQAALRAEMDEQLAAMRAEIGGSTGVHGGEAAQPQKSGEGSAAEVPASGATQSAASGVANAAPAVAGAKPDGSAESAVPK